MIAVEELELIREFESDSNWLRANREKIREEYVSKFVAVQNRKVIGANKNLKALVKQLKKEGINTATTVIKYMPEKDVTVIY